MSENKKLYVVEVSFSFPVLADDEDEAVDFVEQAEKDLYLPDVATPRLIKIFADGRPEHVAGWSAEDLVYGEPEATLEEAVEAEKNRRHDEEMLKKQGKLFGEGT